jgi:hypothetical protein
MTPGTLNWNSYTREKLPIPWRRVLLEKLTVAQPWISPPYIEPKYHWYLSWMSRIQSKSAHPNFLRFVLILSLFSGQFIDTFRAVILLQDNATMRAVSACLILLLVTAHMSVAKILTKCEFLKELKKQNVAEKDLATCELNSWQRLLSLFHWIRRYAYRHDVTNFHFPQSTPRNI